MHDRTQTLALHFAKIEGLVSAEVSRLEANGIRWDTNEQKAAMRQRLRPDVVTGAVFTVAEVSAGFAEAIGASTTAVLLSDDTLLKQMINRQGQHIGLTEYALVQGIIDHADIVASSKARHYLFLRVNGAIYVVVLKVTGDGKEIYLQSFREGEQREIRSMSKPDRIFRWKE